MLVLAWAIGAVLCFFTSLFARGFAVSLPTSPADSVCRRKLFVRIGNAPWRYRKSVAQFEKILLNDIGRFNASQMPLDDLEHLICTCCATEAIDTTIAHSRPAGEPSGDRLFTYTRAVHTIMRHIVI